MAELFRLVTYYNLPRFYGRKCVNIPYIHQGFVWGCLIIFISGGVWDYENSDNSYHSTHITYENLFINLVMNLLGIMILVEKPFFNKPVFHEMG